MNRIIAILAIFAQTAFSAAEAPSLPSLKGVALLSLTQTESFELKTGSFSSCVYKDILNMETYTCEPKGFSATLTSNGTKEVYTFERSVIYKKHFSSPPRDINEFVLIGHYSKMVDGVPLTSDIKLNIWYDLRTPEKFVGSLSLPAYNQSAAIEARAK